MAEIEASQKPARQKSIEDYLKTIYSLEEIESPVSTSRIAGARDVKPASATSMVQRLDRLGLVSYTKHRGVTLTESGRLIAVEMLRHHRLLELYLTEVLGFGWHEVHEEAELLEHVISEKFEERIAAALDHPLHDPHGAPIPDRDGSVPTRNLTPLVELEVGAKAMVALVTDDSNKELLTHLADLGLTPGAILTVLDAAPFEGPLTVEIEGQRQIVGHKAAGAIQVSLES
jgi:DtxR family Mn-dependent transcriptional regulator